MDIGLALGGAVFTETVYSLPGLGKTAVQALDNFDLPTMQGIVVFATIAIIIFNLIVDLIYAWIDPTASDSAGARAPLRTFSELPSRADVGHGRGDAPSGSITKVERMTPMYVLP